MVDKWVQRIDLKKGSLSRQLGIREDDDIPFGLLEDIVGSKVGDVVDNVTGVGRGRIKVTPLLKRRSVLALNLKRMNR